MRSYQVFAAIPSGSAVELLRSLAEASPIAFAQAVAAASVALKSRPSYLQRLPFEKRAEAVRRALARVAASEVAEETLAVYFLECRKDLLVEWLDVLGLPHDDGMLEGDAPPAPQTADLEKAITTFRESPKSSAQATGEEGMLRELLLHAFAAQNAIDWPDLESRLAPLSPSG